MFFKKKDGAPSVQLYGKLPLAKDYLRIGFGHGTAADLRAWLDEAFSGAAEKSAQPTLAWPMRFLLGGSEPLVGCIWPSSDAGGLRSFPFAMAVERRKRDVADDLAGDASVCEETWRRLEELYRENVGLADGRELLAALRGVQLTTLAAELEPPERVALDAWTKGLFGDAGDVGLTDLVERLRSAATSTTEPVRLPLVADLPTTVQALGWWSLLRGLGLAGRSELPSLFFPQRPLDGDESAFVVAFRTGLRVVDAEWLAPTSDQPLARTDLSRRARCALGEIAPSHENTPPLTDSLRGVLVGLRGR